MYNELILFNLKIIFSLFVRKIYENIKIIQLYLIIIK